jgi:hypothetical protein
MNNQSENNRAWIWYDDETLKLHHVSFNELTWDGKHLAKMEMDFQSALDIVSGTSRLFEYELVKNGDNIELLYKKKLPPFKKFWQLVDAEQSISSVLDTVSSRNSPVKIIEKNKDGFIVDIVSKAKNIMFYVTMKNDPNYLIQKIDLYPHMVDCGAITGIPVPFDEIKNYSIYVRYDAA